MDITDFGLHLFSLAGRRAVVTGGNTGLGRAFTLALAAAGADVLVAALAPDDGTTARLVEATGRRLVVVEADITAPGVAAEVVQRCVDELGGIDILVNSAGICELAPVEDFGRAQWDPMVAVNLTAAFELAHEAARFMIPQRSGKIINIASLFSYLGGRTSPAYAATKAGLVGFTRAYCDDWPMRCCSRRRSMSTAPPGCRPGCSTPWRRTVSTAWVRRPSCPASTYRTTPHEPRWSRPSPGGACRPRSSGCSIAGPCGRW